eukprot:12467394-Ditylum_brightwellii.AAC.1
MPDTEEPSSRKHKSSFLKSSKEHGEFVKLVEEKGWTSLPLFKSDSDLKSFTDKYRSNREQVGCKFNDLKKKSSTTNLPPPPPTCDIKNNSNLPSPPPM